MPRSFRTALAAVGAVLAFSALGASAASAALFHSEAEKTTVSGSQTTTHKLTTDPGTWTCTTVTFAGELPAETAESITITPTYQGCTLATIFGNIALSINFNGCDYLYNASGELHLICPAGKNIVVSGPGCTVTFPPQTFPSAVSYTNTGAGSSRDLDLSSATTGFRYNYSGFTCGSGSGTANGTYTGTSTFTGSAGIWLE